MREIENNCVCCDIPCINCGRRHEEVLYCDSCDENSEELYDYFGEELCKDCLLKRIIIDFVDNADKDTAIQNIDTLFSIPIIKKKNKYYLDKNVLKELLNKLKGGK